MTPLDLLLWVGAVAASAVIIAGSVAIVVGLIRGTVKPTTPKPNLRIVSPGKPRR